MKKTAFITGFLRKKTVAAVSAILTAFLIGIGGSAISSHYFSEDIRFQEFISDLFQEEVTSSTLTLHYTLCDPASYGIQAPEPTLGTINADADAIISLCHTYESRLSDFDSEKLTKENQITLDTLLLYFHTRGQLMSYPLLYEPLSPSLGIQAQLPVLLAEYTFTNQKDILDYLKLLSGIKPYFKSILDFEKEKSKAGYFMSDSTLNRIQNQCQAFIHNPKNNYMQEIFAENIKQVTTLTEAEKNKLLSYHQKLLQTEVIPAYQMLLDELEELRGTGDPTHGLAGYPDGAHYYQLLFQSETGIYDSVSSVEQRLARKLMSDSKEIQLMLKEQPSLFSKLGNPALFQDITPKEILTVLKDSLVRDFPGLPDVSAELKTVHPSMQDYLSPAFYLTPPIDTGTPNVIYLNEKQQARGLELFTTLAHEGFPGHLYQTVSFEQKKCSPIRYLLTNPGYTEGWATYIEEWAAKTAVPLIQDPAARDIAHLYTLNRNINLCMYSLLDIGIHYHAWTSEQVSRFLSAFGIHDEETIQEIYQYIVETPANYPKYYAGSLEFQQLRDTFQQKSGKNYSLKKFHQYIISMGPVPFPVLKKYLKDIV